MLTPTIIVAFVVLFIHACFWEGMILEKAAQAMHKLPDWLKKPLYDCPICMAIWWGPTVAAAGIVGAGWPITNLYSLGLVCAGAAGINTLLIYLITIGKDGIPNAGGDQ